MNKEERIQIQLNQEELQEIIYCYEKDIEYIKQLEQENKELHNKIHKVIKILKEHFVEEYIRSCDTSDGVGRCEIDTEHWTYEAYEILKDVDVDE